jgi:hypothetical protein
MPVNRLAYTTSIFLECAVARQYAQVVQTSIGWFRHLPATGHFTFTAHWALKSCAILYDTKLIVNIKLIFNIIYIRESSISASEATRGSMQWV